MVLKNKETPDDFLTTAVAARVLEISGQRVIQLERRGKLAATKTTNGWRLFRRSEIEKFKQARDLNPTRTRK